MQLTPNCAIARLGLLGPGFDNVVLSDVVGKDMALRWAEDAVARSRPPPRGDRDSTFNASAVRVRFAG